MPKELRWSTSEQKIHTASVLLLICSIAANQWLHVASMDQINAAYTQNGLKEYDIEIYNCENPGNKCLVLQHKLELVWNAETLIQT